MAHFEKQLDSLFGAEALDISTDITVLEGMLEREGLANTNAFGMQKENKICGAGYLLSMWKRSKRRRRILLRLQKERSPV